MRSNQKKSEIPADLSRLWPPLQMEGDLRARKSLTSKPASAILPYADLGSLPVHIAFAGQPGSYDFIFEFQGGSLEIRDVTVSHLQHLVQLLKGYSK
jgi:hypothetical protein